MRLNTSRVVSVTINGGQKQSFAMNLRFLVPNNLSIVYI
jgi:hypothetical protein